MDYATFKALRRSLCGSMPDYGIPASLHAVKHERDRLLAHPPGPSFDLDLSYSGDGEATIEHPAFADLVVKIEVSYDEDGGYIVAEARDQGVTVDELRRKPDEDEQNRPDHCAVLVEYGGNNGWAWAWIYDSHKPKAPAGMARGPAEEYRRAEARAMNQAIADVMRQRANGYLSDYCVSMTIETEDGEEVFTDSLGLVTAKDESEAARYYLSDYGIPEALSALEGWRDRVSADLRRRAGTLLNRAAILGGYADGPLNQR